MASVGRKIDVLRMINTFDANANVARVQIELDSGVNESNSQIVRLITNRYTNVYELNKTGDRMADRQDRQFMIYYILDSFYNYYLRNKLNRIQCENKMIISQ